eukprot:scaffold25923_cov105-Isochrysis_galbana.AAC.2
MSSTPETGPFTKAQASESAPKRPPIALRLAAPSGVAPPLPAPPLPPPPRPPPPATSHRPAPRLHTSCGWPRKPPRRYTSAPETPSHRQSACRPRAAGRTVAARRGSRSGGREAPSVRGRNSRAESAARSIRMDRTGAPGSRATAPLTGGMSRRQLPAKPGPE